VIDEVITDAEGHVEEVVLIEEIELVPEGGDEAVEASADAVVDEEA
jgi:hypothetical protein